jgi:rSAM/selenodomain-associated transferase 1
LRDTLAAVARIEAQKAVLYTPGDGEAEIQRMTPFDAIFLAQRGATLGERMRNGASELLARGFGRVVLVGADLPTLPAAFVMDALERLERRPKSLVLGPAEDGGYYLVGVTHVHNELFAGIPWGTADVLRQTQKAADALRLTVELLPRWYDVDIPADLERARQQTHDGDPVANYTRLAGGGRLPCTHRQKARADERQTITRTSHVSDVGTNAPVHSGVFRCF